jgi:MFS superfamily sulfate permease-like transporter
MLTIGTEDPAIVVIRASGRLTKVDYERFVPEFEQLAQARRPLRMLITLDDFHGWDLPGLWEELKFDTTHQKDMGRVAIVGAKAWQEWGTRLSKPFFKAEMRYFDRDQSTHARAWLTAA